MSAMVTQSWAPLWFAMLFCITMHISYITPPFAYSIFYLKGIAPAEVKLTDIYRGCIPFIGIQFLAWLILYLWPSIATYLPNVMRLG